MFAPFARVAASRSRCSSLRPSPHPRQAESRATCGTRAAAPIARAHVTVVGTRFGAVTIRAGAYLIDRLPAGAYSVRVQATGFASSKVHGIRVRPAPRRRRT